MSKTMSNGEKESLQARASKEDGGGGDKRAKDPLFVYALTGVSALGGFLFGYDTGVVSGAMLLVRNQFSLNHVWHELIVSVTVAAAWLFSLVGGSLSDRFGRKPMILVASFLFTVGAVVMGAANDKETLLAGRIIVGLAIGLASCVIPMYIAELAPSDKRGRLVTINTVFITGGQFIASVLCGAFAKDSISGWRYMLGLSGVPSFLQFVCFLGMPESPRWLVKKGRTDHALRVLRTIRGSGTSVDEELEAIQQSCNEDELPSDQSTLDLLGRLCTTAHVRRALILGCALMLFQQLSGINTVMYYSAAIIQMAGIRNDVMAIWLAAVTAFLNFIFSFIGLCLVERLGRRRLTLVSLLGVVGSLIVLAVGFQLTDIYAPPVIFHEVADDTCSSFRSCSDCTRDGSCGFCYILSNETVASNGSCLPVSNTTSKLSSVGRCSSSDTIDDMGWAFGWCPSDYTWITLLGLALYLFCFAPGMGPMPWTINAEIFPLWARGTCYSIATSCNWLGNLFISMTFLTFTEVLTKEGAFYLYAGLAFVGLVFFYLVLPETKGRDLEEVEGLFARPWCSGGSIASDNTIQSPPPTGPEDDSPAQGYTNGKITTIEDLTTRL